MYTCIFCKKPDTVVCDTQIGRYTFGISSDWPDFLNTRSISTTLQVLHKSDALLTSREIRKIKA